MGRVRELAALSGRLEAAAAGHGSIALVTGAPGIGKSRLATELGVLADKRRMTTLWGRSLEGETGRSFAPWVEALSTYIRQLEPAELQRQLGVHAAVVARLVPAVREVLTDSSLVGSTSPTEARQQLFDAIVPFVLSEARVRPVLLILDDVQSADRASLALLRYLARSVGNSGILILATFRDEEVVAGHPLAELVPTLRREAPLVHVASP